MSCRNTPAGSALTTIARLNCGGHVSDVATLSMFHELRRQHTTRIQIPDDPQFSREVYDNFLNRQITLVNRMSVSQRRRESLLARLQAAQEAPTPDNTIQYALYNIEHAARERSGNIDRFIANVATRLGQTPAEVQIEFDAITARALTRRRATPHTQINIDLANRYNLGNDVGILDAVSVLNDQARAIEAAQITQGVQRITRIPVTNEENQKTGIDNLLVVSFGVDPRNGRIEVEVLDTTTGERKVYAYRNGQNIFHLANSDYLNDAQHTSIGSYWERNIRGGNKYAYPSPESAEKAGIAPNCETCGQFSTVGHGCPLRNEPQVLTFESTTSLWSNQKVGTPTHHWNQIKVNLPPIREFRNALTTGGVVVKDIEFGHWNRRVKGDVLAFLDEEYNLKINTSQLYCNCGDFLTNETCEHIGQVKEGVQLRLEPAAEILKTKTPAKRNALVAKALEKLEAERVAEANKAFASDWTRKATTLEEAKNNWIKESEVIYSDDFVAFERDYNNAMKSREDNKEPVITYSKSNVLNGMATRASGQGFGVELEYCFDNNMSSSERLLAQITIGEELFAANLTPVATQVGYHNAQREGYKDVHVDADGKGTWSWEQDGSVNGELVSPTMYDEPETWEKLEQAIAILRKNGATVSTKAGSHVHVGTGFYDGSPEKYTELARIMSQHEDVLFRLATDPVRGTHRGLGYTQPIRAIPNQGFNSIREIKYGMGGRGALNYAHVQGSRTDHPEFRLFDSSLNPGVIQAQIKLAVSMTHAAVRQASSGGTKRPKEEIGAHFAREEKTPKAISLEEETTTLRSLLDTLFTRHEDKAQLVSIFANTRWTKGQEVENKRRRPRI